MNKKNIQKIILTLIFGGILVFIWLNFINFTQVLDYLKKMDYKWAILSLLAYSITYFVRAARWKVLLDPTVKMPYKQISLIYWAGLLINFIIPIRIGEIAKSYIIKKINGVPISKSLASVFLDKIADFLPIILLFILVPFLPATTSTVRFFLWVLMIIFLLMAAFLSLVIIKKRGIVAISDRYFSWLGEKWTAIIANILEKFIEGIEVIKSSKIIVLAIIYTLIALLFDTLYVVLMFKAFGYNINWVMALFGYTLFNLSFIFPSPPAQVGTTEAIHIIIFTIMFGIDRNLVAATLGFAHLATGIINVLYGSLALMILNVGFSNILSNKVGINEKQ